MKMFKKTALVFIMVLTVLFSSTVYAVPAIASVGETEEAGTYSQDVVEYIYRVYNGVLQYRRWNATKGIWVDPAWINV